MVSSLINFVYSKETCIPFNLAELTYKFKMKWVILYNWNRVKIKLVFGSHFDLYSQNVSHQAH